VFANVWTDSAMNQAGSDVGREEKREKRSQTTGGEHECPVKPDDDLEARDDKRAWAEVR
jgi:hypothetical protein